MDSGFKPIVCRSSMENLFNLGITNPSTHKINSYKKAILL